MWQLKFVAKTENTIVGKIAAKHQVVVQLYPLLTNRTTDSALVNCYGIVFGPEDKKIKFIKDFSRLEQVINVKKHDDAFLFQYKEKEHHAAFYNPEVIFIEPWTIDGGGNKHCLLLGSWKREVLVEMFHNIKSHHKADLLMLKMSRINKPSLVFCNVRPHLTQKQRLALDLAIKQGYYEYPRKTSVEKLSQLAGLSFSTFQAHLRKAEKKIIPYSHKLVFSDTYR